jgi:hypothetical protein
MPRFFFDFREDECLSTDEEGLDLPDVAAAESEAAKAAADVGAEVLPNGSVRAVMVQVRSETGQRVMNVTVSMAVQRF